nr:thioredoxin domain-containing protein [uncultured Sphingomonas sp.]
MNKFLLVIATAMATTALAPAAAAAPAKKAVAQRDWSKTVVPTTGGGFRMGNPAAKVKLVEYGSMTCSHCAHFANDDEAKLVQKYVSSGKASFEFRNFVMNPYDMAASLTARCSGPSGFFPVTHKLFATQQDWINKLRALGEVGLKPVEDLPAPEQMQKIADLTGFTDVAKSRGYPVAKYKACIGNQKNIDVLVKMRNAADSLVEGTPTFTINGTKVEFSGGSPLWDQLDAKIAAAL